MKILMLCLKFPYPPKDGGNIAMLNMIHGFDRIGHELTVLAMNTPKHYFDLKDLPDEWLERAAFYAVNTNTTPNLIDALSNLLFSKQSYHIRRFTLKSFEHQLEILFKNNQFDIIQLETLYLTPYLPLIRRYAPKALVSLRAHNIEHEIWARKAQNESPALHRSLHRFYFEKTALRLKKYEEDFVKNAEKYKLDAIVAITDRDAAQFGKMKCSVPVKACNVGIEIEQLEKWEKEHLTASKVDLEYPSVFYIGAMDWIPNQEGLQWFLKQVWPIIHQRYPEVVFYIAGRNLASKRLFLNVPNLEILGEVEDAYEFMSSKAIMVVPLFSGSGMRVKIVEGMALGKAIVATPIAAEGIGAKHGQQLFLAEKPEAFADCISVLLEKRGTMDALGKNAKSFARKKFDNHSLAKKLLDFYEEVILEKREQYQESNPSSG